MTRNEMDDGGPSDEALASSARRGDREAYAELWRRHADAGTAAARRYSHIADPDDLLAEASLRIFASLRRGNGPQGAFRPYLYRTILNIALDARRPAELPLEDAPETEFMQPGPESGAADRAIGFRAFRALPERWQSVLWYLDVEGLEPAQAAPLLGLSPNATSALAARARDGLKKAWLQAHVSEVAVPEGCRWTTERMGEYARGGLSARGRARFDAHLATCRRCTELLAEIDDASGRLAVLLLPLLVGGPAAAALLARRSEGASPAPGAQTDGHDAARVRLPRPRASRLLGTGVAAAASVLLVTAIAVAATSSGSSPDVAGAATPGPTPTEQPVTPASPEPADPEPAPAPQPPGPGRSSAPVVPPSPVAPVVPPPAVPPAAPLAPTVVLDPVSQRITVSGAGDLPGATIEVRGWTRSVVTGVSSPEILLASVVVAPDGTWTTPPAGGLTPINVSVSVVQVRDGLSSGPVVLITDAFFDLETASTAATVAGSTASWQILGWAGGAWEIREPGSGTVVASGVFDAAGQATASVPLPAAPSGTVVSYDVGYVQDGAISASPPGLTVTVP